MFIFGAYGRLRQFATWKRLCRGATATPSPVKTPSTRRGSQFVGFTVKFGRSRFSLIERSLSGIPPTICGSWSDVVVTRAVKGSTETAALTTTLPRSYGPDTAGVTATRLSGAPLYDPAR